MSNSSSIAAVTATLRSLLDRGVRDEGAVEVTTLPLDKAKLVSESAFDGRLNLFLYLTQPNGGWRNLDIPRTVQPGENGQPPLGLDLFYLLTAFEKSEADTPGLAHQLLGAGLRTLHDHPLLGADEIRAAFSGSRLEDQIERVRITPHPLSVDELSKLWVMFQAEYRISAAYQVSVVLIESTRPVRTPLPVLKRGTQDQGAAAVTGASPSLRSVRPLVLPAGSRLAARLGEDIEISGDHLDAGAVTARFIRRRNSTPADSTPAPLLTPLPGGSDQVATFHLPAVTESAAAQSAWAPGLYDVTLMVTRPNLPAWATNIVPLMLAPRVTLTVTSFPAGDFDLSLDCSPRVREGQGASLLFGDRQIPLGTLANPADPTQPSTLTFRITGAIAGRYVVRLRVDGVDSVPVVLSGSPPVAGFDPAQIVTIT